MYVYCIKVWACVCGCCLCVLCVCNFVCYGGVYPFHLRQAGRAHASPAVERDWATVTFDTDWSCHRWDFAGGCAADDGRHRGDRIGSVTATGPDLWTPTTNLNTYTHTHICIGVGFVGCRAVASIC